MPGASSSTHSICRIDRFETNSRAIRKGAETKKWGMPIGIPHGIKQVTHLAYHVGGVPPAGQLKI